MNTLYILKINNLYITIEVVRYKVRYEFVFVDFLSRFVDFSESKILPIWTALLRNTGHPVGDLFKMHNLIHRWNFSSRNRFININLTFHNLLLQKPTVRDKFQHNDSHDKRFITPVKLWHEIRYSCQILKSNDATPPWTPCYWTKRRASNESLRSCRLLPWLWCILHEVVIEAEFLLLKLVFHNGDTYTAASVALAWRQRETAQKKHLMESVWYLQYKWMIRGDIKPEKRKW